MSPSAEAIAAALGSEVVERVSVPGGDANRALRVELADGRRVFVKYRRGAKAELYEAEAEGLAWLAEPGVIAVPEALAVGAGEQPFLALPWLELGRLSTRAAQEDFGRALAALHGAGAPAFGHDRDNFIGPLPQRNAPGDSWAEFYGRGRLAPMARAAVTAGGMDEGAIRDVDRLIDRLPELLGPPEPPARLHGDLWSGNAGILTDGTPCLIDPAVYGGHREVDLAMMALFGGFDDACFGAYAEAFPLAEGWRERMPLHQLFPLLVHAVLFGGGYGARAADIVRNAL